MRSNELPGCHRFYGLTERPIGVPFEPPTCSYQKYPDLKFRIEGHTDNTGSKSVNDKLSQARADAVRKYLIDNGRNANNLTAVGYGSDNPIGDNATNEGRQANRRVEIFQNK